ncbi:MAG: threonine--tRNA ligase [Bacilli bacterium]|jgi:threonyl-tRNA synthetase|nr:threonine--tRNA ligase [Bacilli bacterium]MDY0063970.1 threonine--tRNA ligase [Bacilli bacterium]
MKITFKDGNSKDFEQGKSAYEIASSISSSLAKKSIYAMVNNEPVDLHRPLFEDAVLELKMKEDAFEVLNHSCSHLLAAAIKKIYPHAMFGVGPAIEEGFYYDMNLGDVKLSDADFPAIEKEMNRIASQDHPFKREEVTKEEAKLRFKNDRYKQEIIDELPADSVISLYQSGDFVDLCRGPHLPSTKFLKHFKLLHISGAYWRGDSQNEQLQRIYGVCFFEKEQLDAHLILLEEREKRDHRRLGKELDLFMISEYGPGFPFWLPKGMILRRALENYWFKVHTRENYQFIQTPIMLSKELWEISGHWSYYRENMYVSEIDEKQFVVKPMNCPGGMLVYRNSIHSYKDFPLRVGELGLVHRHEASGALTGLFRVRNFTQDDAHIFMREDQIVSEIGNLIRLFEEVYSVFQLEYHIELSTRPEKKYIGEIETWNKAEEALAKACHSVGRDFKVNPGDGAFYGPKLDFKLRDSMNRIWQCGTIQLDMFLPERFDLTYIDENGEKRRPIMLHRALFGSLERFIGVIIEHFGGAFPTWLAPVQVKLIPVNNEAHLDFVQKLAKQLQMDDIRVEIDQRDEKLGYKIRDAQMKKIPYQLVVGDKEVESNTLTIRKYKESEVLNLPVSEFIAQLIEEIKTLGQKC